MGFLMNQSSQINQSEDSYLNNTNESFPEPDYCDGFDKDQFLIRSIWIYGGYPIIILGTIGHLLSLVLLLLNRGIRALSLSIFLLTMSLSGLMALYAGLLSTIVTQQSCHNFAFKDRTTEMGCQLHMAAIYFSLQLYSWMEACVSVERMCAVTRPHKYKLWFTRRNNVIATGIIVVILICLNVIPYKAYGYKNYFCSVIDDILFKKWRYAHCIIYVAFPVAIMIPSNGVTLYTMCHSHFKDSANVKKAKPITIMMFVLNGIFIFTTIPIMVGDWENLDNSAYESVVIAWTSCRLLMYLGSSLTFAVYLVVSARFRKALKELLNSGFANVSRAAAVLSGGTYKSQEQIDLQGGPKESATDSTSDGKL